ncbi:NAD dependent epimerase/dehydratase family enzyme [Mycetocola sp. CAN_C7]|uniref:epimerase n=1 Tax=Mycetocola sp. CAN_C7 TaxID=2787724 RepID=UPI0018CAE2F8
MTDRVVIAGASGFVGSFLVARYRAAGTQVSTIGRSGADAVWGETATITRLLDGADLLINLAGKSVNCRYTPANRAEILRSRVETTRELNTAIRACSSPPALWVNSSTATIYRHADDRPMTESTGELGTGFSVGIARAWEEEFFAGELQATRRVALRLAIVLGDGSALAPLRLLTRLGLGGTQRDGRWPIGLRRRAAGTGHEFGSRGGRQKFSWIHLDDVARILDFVRKHPELDGIVNASSPNPSDNRSLMAALRRVLGVRIGLPTTRWMLELGTAVIRSETELVLKSRWVVPERLSDAGFTFAQPQLEPALVSIIRPRRTADSPSS